VRGLDGSEASVRTFGVPHTLCVHLRCPFPARKCFHEFVNIRALPESAWGLHKPYNDPVAQLLVQFLEAVKALGTAEADAAFDEVNKIRDRYIDHPSGKKVWASGSQIRADLEARTLALRAAGDRAAELARTVNRTHRRRNPSHEHYPALGLPTRVPF
jgi:hypothetical protein